jgi:flagellar basal body-associated protein FliL
MGAAGRQWFGRMISRLGIMLVPIAVLAICMPGSAARAEEGGEQKPVVAGPTYIHFMPLSFSVIGTDNRIFEQVSISLVLELAQGKGENSLDPYTPRLQDAYLTALNQMWDEHPVGSPPVTAKEIKEKLLTITNGITGPGFVAAILLSGIDERMR